MHKSFIISEEERKRILGIHENATKSQYLNVIKEGSEVVPSDEVAQEDAKTTFVGCPCVTKQGWSRGMTNSRIIYYTDSDKNRYYVDGGVCKKFSNADKASEDYRCASESAETPSEEVKKNDAEKDFKLCPCVTKMGWIRGTDINGYPYYQQKNGRMRYYGVETWDSCYKYPVDKDGNEGGDDKKSKFNCNSRPFTQPAKSGDEIKAGKKLLYLNDKSPMMPQIQEILKSLGKLPDTFQTSEKYDKETYKAIREFQKEKGLRVDGVIGKNTWGALFSSQVVQMEPKQATDILKTQIASDKEKQEKELESKMTIKTNEPDSSIASSGGGTNMGQAIGNVIAQDLKNSSYNMEAW